MLSSFERRMRGASGSLEAEMLELAHEVSCGAAVNPGIISELARERIMLAAASLRLADGVLAMITGLTSVGAQLAVCSDAGWEVAYVLESIPFGSMFRTVSISCETGYLKSEPAGFDKVLSDLSAAPDQCMFVGDGGSNELAVARGLGFRVVQISGRPGDLYDWSDRAHDHLSSLAELPRMFEAWRRN